MIKDYFGKHMAICQELDLDSFQMGVEVIRRTFESGGKIITCGNGGSALTALHYVTDWNKAITDATGIPFRGISLVDNIGLVTAFANDVSYPAVFSSQLEALLCPEDLVVVVSGSGNSENVINAVNYANIKGADTLAILGYDGGKLKDLAKNIVLVPSFDMQICEDIHLMFGHIVVKELTRKKDYSLGN